MSAPAVKLLLVLDGLWVGGTERSVAEMLPYLAAEGLTPTIACLRQCDDEGVEREVVEAGFEVRFLPPGGLPTQVRALRRLLRTERPTLVHSALYRANLVTRLAAPASGAVVVNSLVNTPYEPVRLRDPAIRPTSLRVVRWIDGWTGRWLVDHFHAVSEAARQAAIRQLRLRPERITVVHRGRDPERLGKPSTQRRRQARSRLGLADSARVLVHLGRQDYQKGLRHLLEALVRLAPTRPDLVLLQAGRRGSASDELEEVVQRNDLASRVRFLGHRERPEELLAAGDLFVFPSLFEGLPGAVIEAMALGLPIVAAGIPATRELVEADRNALLVAPCSAAELAREIDSLLAEPDRMRRMGRRSRALFEERYTLSRSAAGMVAFYRRLTAGADPG